MRNLNTTIWLFVFFIVSSCSLTSSGFKPNRFKLELKHGLWLESIDSTHLIIVKYIQGKKEGKAKIVYNTGETEILFYKRDLKDGVLKHYTKNGKLCYEITYKEGIVIETKRYCSLYF